jgi:hypothetical protein
MNKVIIWPSKATFPGEFGENRGYQNLAKMAFVARGGFAGGRRTIEVA